MSVLQGSLDLFPSSTARTYVYGQRSSGGTHGVVLTKPHVVDLLLDLAEYTDDRDLGSLSLLEPACGEGAFLTLVVRRLLASARRHGRAVEMLTNSIVAFDIDADHVRESQRAIIEVMRAEGVPLEVATRLAAGWVREGDFLLAHHECRYDAVVGNPPYIRIEQLDTDLQGTYRTLYKSLYDRADLYVAFIERGLRLLSPTGVLSFICADRWMNNRYGQPLRKLITTSYRVLWYVDLHEASPFESEVTAYPAIFAIGQGRTGAVRVARLGKASPDECESLRRQLTSETPDGVEIHPEWFSGKDPWVLSSSAHLAALRELESRYPSIEADGSTRIGIGVASGADAVFIVQEGADIESDRLVPVVMRDDIEEGSILNGRRYVINTFAEDGSVVDLSEYPRLARYLEGNEKVIRGRHVAKKNPARWFRTIDRVYPDLARRPKLLIPDIAGSNEVTFDPGNYHPHHNLYFVVSESWDLEVLGGLLCSKVALFFVWSYAVKMRGGYLRFQAQYLRRIRLPNPAKIEVELSQELKTAFRSRDFAAIDRCALRAYGIERLPDFDFVDTRS